ncbi:hypothetical protein S40288_05126 [Stachybotrys chartarum IBT 40288]|nr:hypothetical protein S40288_05126 [Stachybotrys chartarum IBT 40288]
MASLPNPKANIVWWNSSSMHIRCPHCDKIHRHGFDGKYHFQHHRVPHCDSDESYSIVFPPDGLYEIDKSSRLYVSAGANPTEYFAQFDPAPKVDVSNRRKWTEAKEELELDEHYNSQLQQLVRALGLEPIREIERGNRLESAVSDMVNGNVQAVRYYLETSREKDIFLYGVEAFVEQQADIDEWDAYLDLQDDQRRDREPPEMKIVHCNGFIRRVNMAFTLNIQLRGAIQCA